MAKLCVCHLWGRHLQMHWLTMIDGERLARLGLDSAASRMQSPNPGLETTIQQRPTELALLKLQQSRTRTTRTTNYKQLLSKDQQHCCCFFPHNSTNVVISIGSTIQLIPSIAIQPKFYFWGVSLMEQFKSKISKQFSVFSCRLGGGDIEMRRGGEWRHATRQSWSWDTFQCLVDTVYLIVHRTLYSAF